MLVSRRHLLGKSPTVGAVTVVSNLAPSLLLVVSDRIQTTGKFSETKLSKRARVIDASGKYMIPDLWDMHVHLRGGADLIPDNEVWLPVFLAHGITGVREMGGDIADTVFRWRTEIANGTRRGPRILTSGPMLDGPKPEWPDQSPPLIRDWYEERSTS
jgi:imidazolonepropionase-like amidohydrolase